MNVLSMELSREFPFKTVGELKEEFYSLMRLPRRRGSMKIRVMEPSLLVMNPPLLHNSHDPLASDIWVALYFPYKTSKNQLYYVKIHCGRSMMSGPHKFELYFQIRTGSHVRLGCYVPEIDFAFTREDIIKQRLRKAIIFKKYFATPLTEETAVELRTSDEPEIEL